MKTNIIKHTKKHVEKIAHPNTLTLLNIGTGIFLVLAGIFYFLRTNTFDMSLSWVIFGAMYLVMESYACDCKQPKRVIVFAWFGFILSVALFVYYLINL